MADEKRDFGPTEGVVPAAPAPRIVRSGRAQARPQRAGDGEKVRVLLVFANPDGTARLRLDKEERALRRSIDLATHADRLEVESLHAATIDDLRRALLAQGRTIVHFAGHGRKDGLRFMDAMGSPFTPDVAAFGDMLRRRGVETVVLNACWSLDLVEERPMGTRYTVAMEGPVGDAGAIEFARGFYEVIGAGGDVEQAYCRGFACAQEKALPVRAVLVET